MPGCGDHILCRQHFSTNTTVISLCQSGCLTSCLHCSIRNRYMSCSRDDSLFCQYFFTDTAMTSFCQSGCLTSCRYRVICNRCMSCGWDDSLLNQYFSADTAMASFRNTGGFTSSCHLRIYLNCMSCGWDFFHITISADRTGILSCSGFFTGCICKYTCIVIMQTFCDHSTVMFAIFHGNCFYHRIFGAVP